jgi:putative transposase
LKPSDKRLLIDAAHPDLSIKEQCDLVGLSRSGYYYQSLLQDDHTKILMNLIDEHYLQYPHEGARKISQMLKQKGYAVGRYRVSALMKRMGIAPIYPKPNTSVPDKSHEVYPYLLKDTEVVHPNQVWASDITYCRLLQGHAYLMVVMDWYSRYVIEWELSTSLEAEFCVRALKRALENNRCEIFNTDQGAQFTSAAWINALKGKHISISMDGRGRYLDNVFVERLWRSVKQECIYRHQFESVKELKTALIEYFNYYNNKRLHQSLDYRTPAEVYFSERPRRRSLKRNRGI